MFATAHLTSGVALALALGLRGNAFAALVLTSVLVDWDYSIQLATGRNHRTFITHSPIVYLAILLPLGFWQPLAWYALAGAMLHFTLDLWDYGIRLDPFRAEVFGARLIPGIERLGFLDYVRAYTRDGRFVAAELGFALAAALLALLR